MFVKYRVGGGANSNVGPNILKSVGDVFMEVNGDDSTINQNVQNSLTVNNPLPAIGGKEQPSLNEIRKCFIIFVFLTFHTCIFYISHN